MYAIIDIETTGGSANLNKITEIAIIVHDGNKVVQEFSSLVNPECLIPANISQFTGITNEMVRNAPPFHAIAKKVIELTDDCIFVAHNVRFDYGFVQAEFRALGYQYTKKTLCTVRLARKAFPGFPSYSLGNLCNSLNIPLSNRHRALGDAAATAILFDKILKQETSLLSEALLSQEIKKTSIPPLLNETTYLSIPDGLIGVYYFYDTDGTVIYVGKSTDIKKRVQQHFKSQKTKKAIRLHQAIAHLDYEITGNELIALLLESTEIKKLKPTYNTAQKRGKSVPMFGICSSIDALGFQQLSVESTDKHNEVVQLFDQLIAAKKMLQQMADRFELCLSKCQLNSYDGPCFNFQIKKCKGACCNQETAASYNLRVEAAIKKYGIESENYFLIGTGRTATEKSVVWVEKGHYKGYGFIDTECITPSLEDLQACIRPQHHNNDIQYLLNRFSKGKKISY
jgi:DNA polymerase-3 subunit epsilon